jgi:hypothetical protein
MSGFSGPGIASQAQAEAGAIDTMTVSPLKLAEAAPLFAQAFRNIVGSNGGLEVWQRGAGSSASIAVAASTTAYTADRWYLKTGANQACVVSAQAGLTNQSRLCARAQRNSGQTGTGDLYFAFPLDTDEVYKLRGRKVVLHFVVSTGADWSPTSGTLVASLITGTGAVGKRNSSAYTGDATAVTVSSNLSVSASAAQVVSAISATLATNLTCAELQFKWTPVGTASTNDWFSVDDVQIEVVPSGVAPVTPVFERSDYNSDYVRCATHYVKSYNYATVPGTVAGGGTATITFNHVAANFGETLALPVRMRGSYTLTIYDGAGATGFISYNDGTWKNSGTITTTTSKEAYIFVQANIASAVQANFDFTCDASI